MNIYIAVFSFIIGCLVCLPLFKYLLSAVTVNASEFAAGYKKVKGRDPIEDAVSHYRNDSTVNSFTTASLVVLILPCIPASFLAVPLYFLIEWALGLFGV
ncbi:hypothetical protein [Alishewanella sp. HL-SH05]|uniref:hypothetical protein n=1 Tax=Alishewanella sp. HL-SH05 TaxID=3461145 RepID=UPI004042185C